MIYVFVLFMTFTGALGAYFFKKSTGIAEGIGTLFTIPFFYVGGFLYVLAALMNVILLRYMDLTVLYPMSAVTYIWSLVLSNRFMGERVTKEKLVGILLIVVGIAVLVK